MDPTFQYAGNVRIPPKQFQLRARIEPSTRDWVNAKEFEHWQTDVPDFTYNMPKITYEGRSYDTYNPYISSSVVIYNAISNRSIDYNKNKQQDIIDPITGYKQINTKVTNIPYMDMSPINTRTDLRDFKQSQPFVAGGPDLAYNPYFDRYDPVSDPRNAIRELRSAVYEDKGGARGEEESQKMLRRQFEHRWLPEELINDNEMDTFLRYETLNNK